MRVLLPIAAIAFVVLVVALVVACYRVHALNTRLKGLDEPELWLPRKERQAHARKLLQREQEQYDLTRQQDLMDLINSHPKLKEPK